MTRMGKASENGLEEVAKAVLQPFFGQEVGISRKVGSDICWIWQLPVNESFEGLDCCRVANHHDFVARNSSRFVQRSGTTVL